MNLKKIFAEITQKLDEIEEEREKILRVSREMIRNCSLAIKSIHRRELEKYQDLISNIKSMHEELSRMVQNQPIYFGKHLKTAEQELAEAACLFSIINDREIPSPKELNMDEVNYSLGLADLIGEIRRYILDNMRVGKMDNVNDLLEKMDEIYTELFSLDYPKGITQELRHKTDVARSLIEKTRGDVTMAMQLDRVKKEIGKED